MTIREIHARLVNEAQQQDAAAETARAAGNERWVRKHERAASRLRERARLLEYVVKS